ncbi:hypothetical protein SEA_KENREY_109 [Streptomyces phage Kenrey]|nr:hypothetical protein SEA_KENREY_109 [Streptomyces phage Kenrey]
MPSAVNYYITMSNGDQFHLAVTNAEQMGERLKSDKFLKILDDSGNIVYINVSKIVAVKPSTMGTTMIGLSN